MTITVPKYLEQIVENVTSKEILKGLLGLGILSPSIAINNRCNYHCKHCYILQGQDFIGLSPQDFSHQRMLDIVDDFQGIAPIISIAGMEPLLTPKSRSSLTKIVGTIADWKTMNLYTNTAVISNLSLAPLLTDEQVNLLSNNLMYLSFSIESGNSIDNDAIRGKGTYQKTVDGVKNIVQRGFNPNVLVMEGTFHPSLDSFNQVSSMLRLGSSLGVKRYSLNPYVAPPREIAIKDTLYYVQLYRAAITAAREESAKRDFGEMTLFATYEVPGAIIGALEVLSEYGITEKDFSLNVYDSALYAYIPDFDTGKVKISLLMWPMEETIAPRITPVVGAQKFKLKDKDTHYNNGTTITCCFGYQRDDSSVGVWIPGLYHKLNYMFVTQNNDLVASVNVPSVNESILFDPFVNRSFSEYVEAVADTMVRRSLQRIDQVLQQYSKDLKK